MPEKYIKASECEKYFYEHLDDVHIAGAMNAVDEMPAAKVVPVRHGRWEATRETNIWGDKVGVLRCSMCNRFKSHGKAITVPYDFCPNCGAKMDGGEGE